MTKDRRSVDIAFYVGDKLYEARVFLFRPTAIVIPDQNAIAITTLRPSPDSSTYKNRYRKTVCPTEKQEAQIDRKNPARKTPRTIFDSTNQLNPLIVSKFADGQPLICNYRHITVATRKSSQ